MPIRRNLLTLILLIFSVTLSVNAQEIRLGGGLIYGTVAKNIGLNFRGDVNFNKQWTITPNFSWFFNKKSNLITRKWNALNIDGHYNFEVDPTWYIYPILGVNLATVSEKVNNITFSNADVGINLGFGSEFYFDRRFSGFGEIKYVISDADQLVIVFGVLYQLNN